MTNKIKDEIDTAQALFSGQRIQNQEVNSLVNFSPTGESDLKVMIKVSETSDEEAYALAYMRKGRAFLREWGTTAFYPFLVLNALMVIATCRYVI